MLGDTLEPINARIVGNGITHHRNRGTMSKHLEKIKQLLVAGEDATQGEWYEYGEPEVNLPWTVFNNGRPVWDFFENNNFIAQAANARDSIKWLYDCINRITPKEMTLLEETKELKEDNARLREALEEVCDGTSDPWIIPIVEKALGEDK